MSVLGELKDAASGGSSFEDALMRMQPPEGAPFGDESGQQGGGGSEGLNKLLGLLEEFAGARKDERSKSLSEIEDEEKFLYGDEEESEQQQQQQQGRAGLPVMDMFADSRPELSQPYGTPNPAVAAPALPPTYLQSHGEALQAAAPPSHVAPPPRAPYGHAQPPEAWHHKRSPSPERRSGESERRERRERPSAEEFPPGVGPDDAKDRQEVEEYEKIQDLLKTIGLDLGVTEISKMASRTKERLQGSKPTSRRRSPEKSKKDRQRHRGSSRSGSGSSSSSSSSSSGSSRSSRSSSRSSTSSR